MEDITKAFRTLWIAALILAGPASWCAGQVIEGPGQPPQDDMPPIIQGLPGTEKPPDEKPSGEADPARMFSDSLTAETVQERLKETNDDANLDKAQKEKLAAQYQQALNDLNEAASQATKAAEYTQKTQSVPAQLQAAKNSKQALEQTIQALEEQPATQLEIPANATLAELQQTLADREDELADRKKQLDVIVNTLKNIPQQRSELSQRRKTNQDRLAETEEQLQDLPANGNLTGESLAERTQWRARWQLLRASLSRLEKEDTWRQASTDLLPLERDIAALDVARLELEVRQWRRAVGRERRNELSQQKAQAMDHARRARRFKKYASLAEHANEIVRLAELRQELAGEIPQAVRRLDQATSRWQTLQDNFTQSRERVNAAGSTTNVGTLLRLQQKKLPDLRELHRDMQARREEIQRLQLASYEVNDRAKELANVSKATEELVDSFQPPPPEEELARLQNFAAELIETEKNQLDHLNSDYNVLLDRLWRLEKVENQLVEETQAYSQFISEHVLWIRSSAALWEHSLKDFQEAAQWLLRPAEWRDIVVAVGQDLWSHPGAWTLSLLLFALVLSQQRKMKRRIDDIGKNIDKRGMTDFRPTLRVLVDTLLLAGLWPAALCWVGYRLTQQLESSVSVSAAGSALFTLGLIFLPVELLRQSCRTNGLVQSHFAWPAPVVKMIRHNLRWLKLLAPPFAFIAALYHSEEGIAIDGYESLGRLCFVLALLWTALFMHRVLKPSGAAFRALIANHPEGWIARLKYVFYAAGVLVPIALAGLAVAGYYYTAGQLVVRFYATALLTLGLLIMDALIQRWLLITRRRLALEQLRQRREAAQAQALAQQAATGNAVSSPVVPTPVEAEDERLDVHEMNHQTRHLVRSLLFVGIVVGLWAVWVDVLPALAVLKNVKIQALTIERTIEEAPPVQTMAVSTLPQTDAGPSPEETPEELAETAPQTIRVPITLADLLLSVLILIVAIMAARNLPGMLEMMVLQRLPIDNAARYAITTLAQYALIIFGGSAAFYVVGLRWQNVQWLAAALMVGLGFGLQEIFANFFSGLVVLLERPVRVGDIVTIGETTGIVTRIRMRATTITNWERQEMIIPNKELITGTVLNWTLSDTIQRVFIQVGIAYGSDTDKATKAIYNVLKNHPSVLEEPPPLVTFAGFGNSTLDFEVRCFLPNHAVKLTTIHELHTGIDRAFREADIEIAFPQQDLHIRTVNAALPTPTPFP